MDRHECYELCVQSPRHAVPLLRAIHGRSPTLLGEDFCAAARLSRWWCDHVPGGRAIAVDRDAEVLRLAEGPGITCVLGDVLRAIDPAQHAVDVVFAGNFSLGELHTRADLMAYLRIAHARLSTPARPGGVLVADTYGGETAFSTGTLRREHPAENGLRVLYTWEQRRADPLNARVVNALHFRVMRGSEVVAEHKDAFVYDWRLWAVPELRDAMLEAGFRTTEVYAQLPDAVDDRGEAHVAPIADPAELEESFVVCVAGRA